GTLFGAPDFARQLSGSELGWQGPWGTTYARNLTPDLETGLGYYKEDEIVNAMKGGKRLDGEPMLPPMPWQSYTAFPDEDLHAIAAFLLSLPAVSHAVPDRVPPGKAPTGSFLTFPAPSAWDAPRAAPASADSGAKH
ncbi:MAG TPA: cytochrome c, partial [Candidatus Eisenbacteria bacterium]